MITPDYCVMMAQYNQWQNNGLRKLVKGMSDADLRQDRGSFFGSIFQTLNHLMWADRLWMSRFDPSLSPPAPKDDHLTFMPDPAAWSAERFRLDGVIREWARGLKAIDLAGDLRWHSVLYDRDFTQDMATTVVHFFNHQTHHRGQIHAMMTAAGQSPIETDLPPMPED